MLHCWMPGIKLAEMLPLLDSPSQPDLEDLERRLTIWKNSFLRRSRHPASDELLLDIRRDLDRQLAPYRRKMTATQLGDLERRYTQKRLFEAEWRAAPQSVLSELVVRRICPSELRYI